ncbi:MAG: ATP-binding cassette domain-containing protein [Clostridia bacterium]
MDKFIVESMNFYYGDFHALKNINMKLAGNRITAFIGPSGCGKSTFLKTLNRMNDLVEGSRVEGRFFSTGTISIERWISSICEQRWAWSSRNPTPFP